MILIISMLETKLQKRGYTRNDLFKIFKAAQNPDDYIKKLKSEVQNATNPKQ